MGEDYADGSVDPFERACAWEAERARRGLGRRRCRKTVAFPHEKAISRQPRSSHSAEGKD